MKNSKQMTQKAASRIQRSTTKSNGGITPKRSFASRAARAAAKNVPSGQGKR